MAERPASGVGAGCEGAEGRSEPFEGSHLLEGNEAAERHAPGQPLHELAVQTENLTTALRRKYQPCAAIGAEHGLASSAVVQSDGIRAVVPDIVLAHEGDANRWPQQQRQPVCLVQRPESVERKLTTQER